GIAYIVRGEFEEAIKLREVKVLIARVTDVPWALLYEASIKVIKPLAIRLGKAAGHEARHGLATIAKRTTERKLRAAQARGMMPRPALRWPRREI
ncbi:MAG: hypothetical protein ACOYMN_23415, partial [Roseimicrobium sp.]